MMKRVSLEEGLSRLEGGISKAKLILDGIPSCNLFTTEDQMNFYEYPKMESLAVELFACREFKTTHPYCWWLVKMSWLNDNLRCLTNKPYSCVYSMSIQHPPFDYSMELYEMFENALKESISSKVLPSLMNKDGATLLVELCNMWSKYKSMAKCLGVFFLYLDRHFTNGRAIESLKDISVRHFRELVYGRFYQRFLDAAISVINHDREQSVDKDLLKSFSTFLVEIEIPGNTRCYDSFENAALENAANYYHHVASQWLLCYSSAEYFHKAQWCLNQEKERAGHYLNEASVKKLLQVVHWQLLVQTESILTEKQKVEGSHGSIPYQELLAGCANLSLGDQSSSS